MCDVEPFKTLFILFKFCNQFYIQYIIIFLHIVVFSLKHSIFRYRFFVDGVAEQLKIYYMAFIIIFKQQKCQHFQFFFFILFQ